MIKEFFETPANEFYLWFIHGSLQVFNDTILDMEKTNITATEVFCRYNGLKQKLIARKEHNFIPQMAKQTLTKLVHEGEMSQSEAEKHAALFYEHCISYLELWQNSFEGAGNFLWFNSTNQIRDLSWPEIENSGEFINSLTPGSVQIDKLFDEVVLVNNILSKLRVYIFGYKYLKNLELSILYVTILRK